MSFPKQQARDGIQRHMSDLDHLGDLLRCDAVHLSNIEVLALVLAG